MIYYPQIGYLIVLDDAVRSDPSCDVSDENLAKVGLEYMFESRKHAYYKSGRMHQLDSELGDIHGILTVGHP